MLYRILFVESYPNVLFGQQRTMLSLLDSCDRKRIEPIVGVTSLGIFTEEVLQRDLPVELFKYPELLSHYGGAVYEYRGFSKMSMAVQAMGYIRSIRSRLKKLSLSGVFCNDMRGLLTVGIAARSLGLPVMIWDKLDKPHGWLDKLQLPLVTCNAIISDAVTIKYPEWQRKRFARKIIRVPNGVDLSRFDNAHNIRTQLPVEKSDIVLGIVGSITERKGLDRILRVFPELCKRIPNLRLLIIGETSDSDEDQRYFDSLLFLNHPRVHMLGMRSDVPDLMTSMDILLVPSRHEGMGQVTVEAMAASKPVVGARAGGIPEVVVDNETGLLFDGDNSEQLMNCIECLANDAALRTRMGEAGRRRVEMHFNRPLQIQKILDLCVGMIEQKHRG